MKKYQLLAAAGIAMMAAGQMPGRATVGAPAAVAQTQAQVGADKSQPFSPQQTARSGTDAAAPINWRRWRNTGRRYPAPGWSVAEDRRRARKARNRASNRRQQRGSR